MPALLSNKSLEALLELPIGLQLAFIRRTFGFSQTQIAGKMNTKQPFVSALEKTKGHLFERYKEFARALGCQIAVVPLSAKLVSRKLDASKQKQRKPS